MNEAYAPLAPTLIRRTRCAAYEPAVRFSPTTTMVEDLRLFLFTWAAGFVFLTVFLS